MDIDPLTLVNLILCLAIVVLGFLGFRKLRDAWPLYIAISFGLFGISHLMTLLGYKDTLTIVVIAIRIIAYLLVLYTVYRVAFKE